MEFRRNLGDGCFTVCGEQVSDDVSRGLHALIVAGRDLNNKRLVRFYALLHLLSKFPPLVGMGCRAYSFTRLSRAPVSSSALKIASSLPTTLPLPSRKNVYGSPGRFHSLTAGRYFWSWKSCQTSMWMKSTRSWYFGTCCSSTSSTGPQKRLT